MEESEIEARVVARMHSKGHEDKIHHKANQTSITMSNTESKTDNQTTYSSFVLLIGMMPMAISSLSEIPNIPIGGLIEGIIMVSFYITGSIISWWYWRRLRASIGWLFFALGISILMVVGVKNNPPAILAFFGSLLTGFVLIISDSLKLAETKNKSVS
jgi:hypothetical protein